MAGARSDRPAPAPAPRGPVFHRYVALGDSFTEGVGDPDRAAPTAGAAGPTGWRRCSPPAPRTSATPTSPSGAASSRRSSPSRSTGPALRPDLVTLYAGGNILRPKVDIDALVVDYANAVGRLSSSGAHIVMFTGFDLGFAPVFRHLRGRVAVYNELVREVADDHGATIVGFWRLREFRDPRLWDVDRMHLSAAGHERMSHAVLRALGAEPDRPVPDLAHAPHRSKKEQRAENLEWARTHLAPWVKRRVQGTSSGDGVSPKHPALTRLTPSQERVDA